MATALSLLKPQALDAVTNRDGAPSSPAEITNVFLASLTEATAGSSSGGVGSTVPVLRAAGTQTESTITTGGVAQNAVAANTSRSAFAIQNTDGTDTLYVSLDGTVATTASFAVAPGQTLNVRELGFIPTGAISIIGPTTGQTYCLITA